MLIFIDLGLGIIYIFKSCTYSKIKTNNTYILLYLSKQNLTLLLFHIKIITLLKIKIFHIENEFDNLLFILIKKKITISYISLPK